MKRWMKVLIWIVGIVAVLLVALDLFAGYIVKGAINTAGPTALGVPITVKSVRIGLLSGHFGLKGLVIGNPEGFDTPEAIRVENAVVDVRLTSLFAKVLVIDRIYVDGPEITYEVGHKGSNISAIQKNVEPSKPKKEAPKPAEKPAKEAKKVQITDFLIEHGKLHFCAAGMGGHGLSMPLPPIHLTDVGKESGGATPKEVIGKVFGAVGDAVGGVGTGITKGAKGVGKGATDAGKAVGEGATKALESVEGVFKK